GDTHFPKGIGRKRKWLPQCHFLAPRFVEEWPKFQPFGQHSSHVGDFRFPEDRRETPGPRGELGRISIPHPRESIVVPVEPTLRHLLFHHVGYSQALERLAEAFRIWRP